MHSLTLLIGVNFDIAGGEIWAVRILQILRSSIAPFTDTAPLAISALSALAVAQSGVSQGSRPSSIWPRSNRNGYAA